MSKKITFEIPLDKNLPDYINNFSIDENFLMIKIGSEIVYSSVKEIFKNQINNIRNQIIDENEKKIKDEYENKINFLNNQLIFLEQQKELEVKKRIDENNNSLSDIKDFYVNSNKELNNKIIEITTQYKLIEEKYNNYKSLIDTKINEEVFKRIETLTNEKIKLYDEFNNKKELKDNEINKLKEEIFILQNNEKNKYIINEQQKNNELLQKDIEIKNLNNKILSIENELNNKFKILIKDEIQNINNKYQNTINELNNKIEKQLLINKELNENIFLLKEQQLIKENNSLSNILQEQKNKSKESLYTKGNIGETIFKNIAKDTFKYLNFFDITDTCHLPQMGDFHLNFGDFNVLVDVKNYENNVQKSERDKIKNDLSFGTNKNIKFGWLISLYSDIDGFSKGSPFEIEIITHSFDDNSDNNQYKTQYIFYINKLNNNPTEILLSILSCCKTIHKITNHINDDFTISKYKEYELKVKDNVINIIENNKNICKTFNDIKKMFSNNDKYLQNILNNELNTIFKYNFNIIEWCKNYIIPSNNKEICFKDIFKKFTNTNKDDINIKFELFSQILSDYYKNNIKIIKLSRSEKHIISNFTLKN